MNFNKKSLLATAGVVAGVLAPAANVFAADGWTFEGAQTSGHVLPLYTSGSAQATSGSVTATSLATVNVKTGYLGLNFVPDLHFTNSFAGGNANLFDNERNGYVGTEWIDGNNTGMLQVQDSRTAAGASAASGSIVTNGWNLKLKLGDFVANNRGIGSAVGSGWALKMNRGEGASRIVAKGTPSFDPFEGNTAILAPDGSDAAATPITVTSGNEVTFWKANPNTGVGQTSAKYDQPTSATLSIPKGISDGAYYAPLTWTLTAGI